MDVQTTLVKDSHTVPRWYLNQFAWKPKRIIVYTKKYEPEDRSTKSQTVIKNFYEYEVGEENTANKYENWFKEIEDRAAKIWPKMVSGKELSDLEGSWWALFVATLFLRTQKIREELVSQVREQIAPLFNSDEYIAQAQNKYLLLSGKWIPPEFVRRSIERVLSQIDNQPAFGHLYGIQQSAENLARRIFAMNWQIVTANPGSFFVTSDAPVITWRIGENNEVYPGYGFGRENVYVLLPMSPRKLFIATPHNGSWGNTLSAEDVDLINRSITRSSLNRVFAHIISPKIKAMVQGEMGEVVYGKDAFRTPIGDAVPKSGH